MNPQTPTSIFSQPPYVHLPSSHKGLKRALVVLAIIAALAGGAYALYYYVLSPAAQAERVANEYVKSLTTDDVDLAAYYSRDDADFSLLESAAQAIKGEYTLSAKTEVSGTYYFLYSLSNASNKYARLIVVGTPKGYRVSSFLYSADAVALVPGGKVFVPTGAVASPKKTSGSQAVSTATGSSAPSSTGPTGAGGAKSSGSTGSTSGGTGGTGGAVASACLAQPDYGAVFVDAADAETVWDASNPYSDMISFNDGDSTYVDDFETGDVYAMWSQFYRAYPTKNYQFHVQAMIPPSAGDTSLADQRAATVAAALVSIGVPQDKIVTDPSLALPDSGDDEGDPGYVMLSVMPGC